MNSAPNLILIAGAAGNIGQATARLLKERGYMLHLADRNESALAPLAEQLESAYTVLDATDAKAVSRLFDNLADKISGLVLASGMEGVVAPIEDYPDEDFQAIMNANVTSVWLGLKHGLRVLKPKKQGSIVVLASISGTAPFPMLSAYAASKHAVMGLVRTAAKEAGSAGIRINAVCPGPVESEMMERIDGNLSERFPERLGGRKNAAHAVPMQRYASTKDIAEMIAWLCSDASKYCTGTAMMVDGGLSCR